LIIDDTPDNIDLIEKILADLPYHLHKTYDGENGLKLVDEISPDLILLDAMMPGISGFEVTQRVKGDRLHRLIPIIMITALESRKDRLKGLESGVDDFVSKPVNVFELRARIANLLKMREYLKELEHAEQIIFSLAKAVEAKDKYTEGHSDRVARLAESLGRKLGMSEESLIILKRGGILHDIGKIGVEESILMKKGELTIQERKLIEKHSEIGEKICSPLKSLKPVLPSILYHHEKFDGSGYPKGLKGEDIPIHARVIGVADYYDALTSERPYRRALAHDKAISILKEESQKGLLDPKIINVFSNMFHK
jgi:putative two-component system response regulator